MKSKMKGWLAVWITLTCISCNNHISETSTPGPTQPTTTSQPIVGGGCEGCEWMYEGMPDSIGPHSTSPGWTAYQPQLIVSGTIFERDGKTPAEGVILYYWHTNAQGLYEPDAQTPKAARDHGRLRGWIKTGPDGHYTIHTSRPAPYPEDSIPAHIHLSVKEPRIANEYYIDLYFADDPIYPAHQRKYGQLNRGGPEVLQIRQQGPIQTTTHDIQLGLNIPNYPSAK